MSNNPEITFNLPLTRRELKFLIKLLKGNEDFYDGEESDIIVELRNKLWCSVAEAIERDEGENDNET